MSNLSQSFVQTLVANFFSSAISALNNDNRLAIYHAALDGGTTRENIADILDGVSESTIDSSISILTSSNLLTKAGSIYEVNPEAVEALASYLTGQV